MKQITLNIEDENFNEFLNYINSLDYVSVDSTEERVLTELETSLRQVKLMQEGKIPKNSANDLIDEL